MKYNFIYNGLDVFLNPWVNKDNIIKTDNNQVVMHPYTAACLLLETTEHDYNDVFNKIGVIDDAVDACIDAALKIINLKIDFEHLKIKIV